MAVRIEPAKSGKSSKGKRAIGAEQTRQAIMATAVKLYGERGIDAVSLAEISSASGQRNRGALQYHFTNRGGLLQAIVDKYATFIGQTRNGYIERAEKDEWSAPDAAAICFVMPIIDCIMMDKTVIHYINLVSQLTAINQLSSEQTSALGVDFPNVPRFRAILLSSMSHLSERESIHRMFLAVNITFHAISSVYNEQEANDSSPLSRELMQKQIICLLSTFFAADAAS